MEIVYVAGAYRGKSKWWLINRFQRIRNIWKAYQIAKKLWHNNVVAICPHINTFWMDGVVEDTFFLKGDLAILLKCNYILMLDNWRKSIGAEMEHSFAITHNIQVFYEGNVNQLINCYCDGSQCNRVEEKIK